MSTIFTLQTVNKYGTTEKLETHVCDNMCVHIYIFANDFKDKI